MVPCRLPYHVALSRFHGADRRHLTPTILKAGFTPPSRPRKKNSSSIKFFFQFALLLISAICAEPLITPASTSWTQPFWQVETQRAAAWYAFCGVFMFMYVGPTAQKVPALSIYYSLWCPGVFFCRSSGQVHFWVSECVTCELKMIIAYRVFVLFRNQPMLWSVIEHKQPNHHKHCKEWPSHHKHL